ncbi:MAG: hypothetical protein M3R08_06490, partial [Bacteroidota bacterium]|nr:hypothetical protein [Bacteroidota bacterium]
MLLNRYFLFCLIFLIGFGRSLGAANASAGMLDCIPPEVTYTFTGDCQIGEFYIELDITSLGDSPSLTVEYDLFGSIQTYPDVQVGVLQLGPFFVDEIVTVTVIHGTDPACNIVFSELNPAADCPFYLSCGSPPITLNFCYQDDQYTYWIFEGLGDGSLILNFLSGQIGAGDTLTIHDGPDADSPIMFQHDDPTQIDLTGINLVSSSPFMYIVLSTNSTGSCANGGLTELSWQIACLDCAFPAYTATVIDDCANDQFSIEVDILTTGDGSTVDLEYTIDNGPLQTMNGIGTGMVVLGPYDLGQEIDITIGHELEVLCDQPLGIFTDTGLCPTLVECGQPNITETYCYVDNDSQFWIYEVVGTAGALYLEFTEGFIEAAIGDSLVIHDGADANAPIIFQHTGGTIDLTGIYMISNSGSLFMTMSSNGSESCTSNANWQWEWFVSCLDCFPAVATFELVQDCDNSEYYIDVNLSSLGSDDVVTITNTGGAPQVDVTAPGNVLVGPFPANTYAQLTLVNDEDPICSVTSENFIDPLCPTFICGSTPLVETYCYGSNESMAWAYALPGTGILRLVFDIGSIGASFGDSLRIYDGVDDQAPLLFEHVNTNTSELGPIGSAVQGIGSTYYAVDVTATGPNLYMELISNGFDDCSTGFSYDPMQWQVFCEACVPPGVNYVLQPDCEHLSYTAEVEIIEAPGAGGMQITESTSGESITITEAGTFPFGASFDLDSTVTFLLTDLATAGCTYNSGPLVFSRDSCVIKSCGIDNYSLCYENSEERWYTYQSEDGQPISLYFLEGHMLPSDDITIYNGTHGLPGQAVIYQGNNGGNLSGITVNSSNLLNALTLRVRSNNEWSCEDGFSNVPLRWDVGCGFVGMNEL